MSASSEYLNVISRLGEANAQAQAESARNKGLIWQGTLQTLGQLPMILEQRRALDQERQMRAEELKQQALLRQQQGQELQMRQQQQQQALNGQQLLDSAYQQFGDNEDAITHHLASSGYGHLVPGVQETFAKTKKARADAQEALLKSNDAQEKYAASIGQKMQAFLDAGGDVENAAGLGVHELAVGAAKGLIPRDDAAALAEKFDPSNPDQFKATIKSMMGATQKTEGVVVSAGGKLVDKATGKTLAENPAVLTPYQQEQLGIAKQREGREASQGAQRIAFEKQRLAQSNTPGSTGALTDEGVDYAATQYRVTGVMPPMGMGNSQARAAIINKAAEQTRILGQSPAAAIQKQAAFKADAASLNTIRKMQNSAEAFEEKALGQSSIIADLSAKVPRTKWPIINSVLQAGRTEITGDENATKLANAITTFAAEYAKIMEGSTGSAAASSDSSRRAAERLINPAMNKGTITGVLDLMKREMDLTQQGYNTTLDHITARMGGTPPTAAPPTTPTSAPAAPGLSYQDYLRSKGQR